MGEWTPGRWELSMFCRSVGNYFDLLGHQSLHLSVLEIGADAGGAASTIMQVLGGTENDVPRFERYTYTDISNANFDHVKETVESGLRAKDD